MPVTFLEKHNGDGLSMTSERLLHILPFTPNLAKLTTDRVT